ncbi:replication-relaxation family protein [Verrucosispora sp. WMMA2121]|uniref:replication-relaxation family protein n=1 Tax=Verrucosispora sp. WMMA2121 TaxID=3015164 RepID=UPI0022B65679|nr:replication-relaxation family protein [Verrucosispora sp. WMMA2121]MCZ7421153.1 replication-relaxation family protein [Verrucosispora sp. WMMA2121]
MDRLRRLTTRDHQLLRLLAEHYVLSTDQITAALFPSRRSARLRLAQLHQLEAVSRFVDVTTGSGQHLYTLGPLGAVVHPTQFNDPNQAGARAPRTSIERTERIIGSRRLAHLLGTNQLFIDLLGYARTDGHARLARWWSEQHTTAAYAAASYAAGSGAGVQPDGHGIWHAGGRAVGFFLEHDNGTEPLGTVLRKLRAYEQLARYGPRYPVLLRVPGRRREQHLLDALAGVPTAMPVATGLHSEHPAGPAWTLTTDPGPRRWLHELPSDHGPDNPATNPHRFPDTDLSGPADPEP